MKYYLLAITFCFLSVFASAQDEVVPNKDVIVFINGSNLYGKILNVTKRYVYIKVGPVPFTFNKSRISRIVYDGVDIPIRGRVVSAKENSNGSTEYMVELKNPPLKKGFYNITYGSILFRGINQEYNYFGSNEAGLGVANISGFQLSKYVGWGIGMGFMSYGYDQNTAPVFTEFRGYLSEQKQSAYYSLGVGFNFGMRSGSDRYTSSKPGSYLHPAIGYKFGSNVSAFMLDLGLQFSSVTYITDVDTFYAEEVFSTQRVVLRLGIML